MPALLGALAEGVLAVTAPIWVLAFAQRHLNGSGRLRRAMARSSYLAFMLQGPVLVALALALRPTDLTTDVKALVVATLGVFGSSRSPGRWSPERRCGASCNSHPWHDCAMVTIVDADPRWPSAFERIQIELRDALAADAPRIEHIGSTSVPGLPSKDVIDVQIAVDSEDTLEPVAAALEAKDWRRSPRIQGDHPVPGLPADASEWRKVFFDEPLGNRSTHVHVRVAGRANARYALLFRDFLRTHPDEVAAYAELKRRLAALAPDSATYADTKDPVCDLIYFAAERWASEIGWAG